MKNEDFIEQYDALGELGANYEYEYKIDGTLTQEEYTSLRAEIVEATNELVLEHCGEDYVEFCKCGEYHPTEEWWEDFYYVEPVEPEQQYYQHSNGQLIPNDGGEHYVGNGEWAEVVNGQIILNYRGI